MRQMWPRRSWSVDDSSLVDLIIDVFYGRLKNDQTIFFIRFIVKKEEKAMKRVGIA